ncbi:MAG: DUF58 domain-containing protein [Myxococcota bacterium]|jgi:uncharacterized protein (DUF58 family)|nr:DUF58 domain-containing protein [Myxococcota bacterium]
MGNETPALERTSHLLHSSPELVEAIENFKITARQILQGQLMGLHRSAQRGTSIEFSEHKLYTPGDDVRHIDWRAYAKSDRYHVKQYEDETNLNIEIILDQSASMNFIGGGSQSKLDFARKFCAALSYLALKQGDGVGLFRFSSAGANRLPARASSQHLNEILAQLENSKGQGQTMLSQHLSKFALEIKKRSLVIVFSDLFDIDDAWIQMFSLLAAKKHDVAVMHILDPHEVNFPYDSPAQFTSMEDERNILVHPRSLRHTYVREMNAFLDNVQSKLREQGIEYFRFQTHTDPSEGLVDFLRARL